MSASVPPAEELDPPLWRTDRADPDRVALVTGLRSFAVAASTGELSWTRETRGAPFDWGGVYGQSLRLTGPWRLGIAFDGSTHGLADTLVRAMARRSRFESLHHLGEFDLLQTLVAPPDLPGVARRLELISQTDRPIEVGLRSAFRPFLAPLVVEGLRPIEYDLELRPAGWSMRAVGGEMRVEADRPPTRRLRDGVEAGSDRFRGPVEEWAEEFRVELAPRDHAAITLLLWGGEERAVAAEERDRGDALEDSAAWTPAAEALWAAWVTDTPTLRFPDAPELERGYELARGALRALYYAPEPGFRALRAGLPWYADAWGRDVAWMLPAVLWLNDAGWAEDTLRTIFRYQAGSRQPLVGAEAGELPMQVAPGPVFLFGTSDTTLYYPECLRRYVAHTGDVDGLAGDLREPLRRLAGWIDAKTDATTGLLRNGGEVEALRDATEGAGRVSFGIDAPDTTIWDSADRRDHAVDLQVLAVRAHRALADLAELRGEEADARAALLRADRLAATLPERYAWPEEDYLLDSVRSDGAPVRRLRPNALLAVVDGLLSAGGARAVVRRAARDDLTTPWGVRTLSAKDRAFDPGSYHEGPVWPIATAWAASAALRAGETALGVDYLRTVARMFAGEDGLANECYRGDAPVPRNSCCLLGFSVGPFLAALFDDLWGIRPDLARARVTVTPRFPPDWRHARAEHLRLGEGRLDLAWDEGTITATWSGSGPLRIDHPGGSATVVPYTAIRLAPAQSS